MVIFVVRESPIEMQPGELPNGIKYGFNTDNNMTKTSLHVYSTTLHYNGALSVWACHMPSDGK